MQENNQEFGPDRNTLNKFLDAVAKAPMMPKETYEEDTMPYVEAPRVIIEFYNKGTTALKAIAETGYFIFHNVKVYEEGKRDSVLAAEKELDKKRKYGVIV